MSGLWSGQFKSEPISGPWRCLSRHFVFFPTQLVLCRPHKFAMGGHHLWVSKDIFHWQQSKGVLRSFANEGVLTSLMNCWKVLITPPYHFHTLSPSNFLMQIKTPFTHQFSKARVHFSFVFLQTCFWDNLFVLIYFWRHLICLGKFPLVMLSRTNTLPRVLHRCRSICT